MRSGILIAVLVGALCAYDLPVRAEERIALVIGNSAYKNAPALKNPASDARLLSEQLKKIGFDVLLHVDLDGTSMRRAIRTYSDRLTKAGSDSVGLIFYAGHGIQVRENNYLIPIDADLRKESDAGLEAIHLADVLNTLFEASNKLNVVILDACRDNPFRKAMKSSGFGLAGFDAPVGTLVSYSTAPNKVAYDGEGQNSPFAIALYEALQDQGLKIEDVLKRVGERVYESTSREQLPWYTTSVHGDYYLSRGPQIAVASAGASTMREQGEPSPPRALTPPEVPAREAGNSPVSNGMTAASKTPLDDIEGRIAFFIEWKFFGSDNGARRLGPDSYAETLEYYYGQQAVPKVEVLKDKERYYKRWPNRRFALDRKSLKISEPLPGVFDLSFHFRFDVENETKHSVGSSTMTLKLRQNANDFVVEAQDEIIHQRDISQKVPTAASPKAVLREKAQ